MVTQKPPLGTLAKKYEKILTVSNALSAKKIKEAVLQIQNVYGSIHRLLGVLEKYPRAIGFGMTRIKHRRDETTYSQQIPRQRSHEKKPYVQQVYLCQI